jgi:hypothetical protein
MRPSPIARLTAPVEELAVQTVDLDAEGDGATPPQIVLFAVGADFEPLVLAQKHLTTLEAQPTALKLLEVATR